MEDPVERAVRDLRAGKFGDPAEPRTQDDSGDSLTAEEAAERQRRREDAAVSQVLAERSVRDRGGQSKRWAAYVLGGYYSVTPVFFVLEWATGLQIRVPAILASPAQRNTYYGICFAFGVLFFLLPRMAGAVALLESSVNIVLVFVIFAKAMAGVLTTAVEDPMEFEPAANFFTGDAVVGVLMAMVVWIAAFGCASVAMSRSIGEALGGDAGILSGRK